jgi:hypothetical protein
MLHHALDMTHHTTSPSSHPLQPYARALEKEHEEALGASNNRPLVGLLADQAIASAKTGRVVVVRRAGPAVPFGQPGEGTENGTGESTR